MGGRPCFPVGLGLDDIYPLIPWDYLIHNFQKFFPFRFLLPATVLHIAQCLLLHFLAVSLFAVPILPYFLRGV